MKQKEMRFPDFVSRFRELQGERSNTEFAEFLGMTRQTVGFYLNGERVPDALGVKNIAQKCGVSADWLLGISDFREREDYQNAEGLYSALISALAMAFDADDQKRIKRCLQYLLDGFSWGLIYFDHTVQILAMALSSTAQCLSVIADVAEFIGSEEEADELFDRAECVLDKASASVYKELGVYFQTIRNSMLDKLNLGYRYSYPGHFDFYGEAQEILKEAGEKWKEIELKKSDLFTGEMKPAKGGQ